MTAGAGEFVSQRRPVIERASPSDRAFLAMDSGEVPEQFGVIPMLDEGGELADGVGGLAVLAQLIDGAARTPEVWFPRPAPTRARLAREAFASRLRAPRHTAQSWHLLRQSMSAGGGLRPPRAARCSLNQPTGPHRQLAMVRPFRVCPPACDQPLMPAQQRARRDQSMSPQHAWQQPGQRRQDCPVGPVRPGPADLTTEHRDLMTEQHDLRLFGRLAATEQHQPAEYPDHDQVEQAKGHEPRSCRNQPFRPNRRSQHPLRVLKRYTPAARRSRPGPPQSDAVLRPDPDPRKAARATGPSRAPGHVP